MFGEGIGFAIPMDSIRACLSSLLQKKKVPHAYMGVKMSTVTPELCHSKQNLVRAAAVGGRISLKVKRNGTSNIFEVRTEDVRKLREKAEKSKSSAGPQR